MNDNDLVRFVRVTREDFGYGLSNKKKAFSPGVHRPLCGWPSIEGRLHPKQTRKGKQIIVGKNDEGRETILPGTRKALKQHMRSARALSEPEQETEQGLPRQPELFSVSEDEEVSLPFDLA